MDRTALFASAALMALGGFTAEASELPNYEKLGFPITRVQVSVLGSAGVRESAPDPALMLADMPASPHQIAVLLPRPTFGSQGNSPNSITIGSSTR